MYTNYFRRRNGIKEGILKLPISGADFMNIDSLNISDWNMEDREIFYYPANLSLAMQYPDLLKKLNIKKQDLKTNKIKLMNHFHNLLYEGKDTR